MVLDRALPQVLAGAFVDEAEDERVLLLATLQQHTSSQVCCSLTRNPTTTTFIDLHDRATARLLAIRNRRSMLLLHRQHTGVG